VILASNTLPSNTGYVAAAYLVFFSLLVIYVAIMAFKLARFEREVSELNELADRRSAAIEQPAEEHSHVAVGEPR
jgi:hypothetical protein